jgi:hypothetical protein
VQLTVQRTEFTAQSTCGELSVDGAFLCYTLELPNKDGLPGSCIPEGTYRVAIYPSPHFGREMPLLLGIPDRSEIEIHFGNDAAQTRGCILVGITHERPDWVGMSRVAFDALWGKIEAPARAGECFIAVLGGAKFPPDTSGDLRSETTGDA